MAVTAGSRKPYLKDISPMKRPALHAPDPRECGSLFRTDKRPKLGAMIGHHLASVRPNKGCPNCDIVPAHSRYCWLAPGGRPHILSRLGL
jgi:hypothetical protein